MAGLFQPPPADAWSSIDVTSIRLREASEDIRDVTKNMRFIAPDDGNTRDRTVMTVPLDRSVAPNESVEIELEWTARIPRPFARTGWMGDYYFIAQWFPKLGVLEPEGWNTHQFHAATEFYSDFGVYDVRLTLRDVSSSAHQAAQSAKTDNADGTTTHHYHGEDIHDFAWTASPVFVDLSQRFEHATLPPVDIRLLLQPEHRAQADRYFAIVKATLQRYGEWFGPYPYGHLTIVDPAFQSESDGMEYPTLVTGRARWLTPKASQTPESTTAHEVGHQWWYGMVANNEFEHAWMDEGINTYATARVLEESVNPNHVESRYFGSFVPWSFRDLPVTRVDNDRLAAFRLNSEADAPWTPTFQVLALDRLDHQLQQDCAVAAYARTAARMADDAANSQHLLRALEVQASEAVRLLRRRARGKWKRPRSGSSTRCTAVPTRSITASRNSAAIGSTTVRTAPRSLSGATAKPCSR